MTAAEISAKPQGASPIADARLREIVGELEAENARLRSLIGELLVTNQQLRERDRSQQ